MRTLGALAPAINFDMLQTQMKRVPCPERPAKQGATKHQQTQPRPLTHPAIFASGDWLRQSLMSRHEFCHRRDPSRPASVLGECILLPTTMSSNSSESAAAVSLPHRYRDAEPANNKPPVWPIDHSEPATVPVPLSAKCDAHDQPDGVCCKDLKEDERHLIDPDIVRDV